MAISAIVACLDGVSWRLSAVAGIAKFSGGVKLSGMVQHDPVANPGSICTASDCGRFNPVNSHRCKWRGNRLPEVE